MRFLNTKIKVFLLVFVVLSLFWSKTSQVRADCTVCDLTHGNCSTVCDPDPAVGCTQTCSCSGGPFEGCGQICGPGTYVTNNGCHPIGGGGCTGCGCWCMCGSTGSGTGEGHGCNVDCNPHPNPNNCDGAHPTYDPSGCPWGQEPGPWVSDNSACRVGQYFDGWFTQKGETCDWHCRKINGNENCNAIAWNPIQRFCQPKCDPNAWGAFGACSVSCGGGTQVAYSACGEATYRECNAQPCKIPPWWQVKNSDISSNGDLVSNIPGESLFDLAPAGGYPGVAAFAGSTGLTTTNVSETGWLANSTNVGQKVYNYDYFTNLIPSDILATINAVDSADVPGSLTSDSAVHDTNNYYWYKYDGAINGNQALTISATNIGSRKVILLVNNADVNITGDINLTDGEGFFMMIVKGNIAVDPTVGGATPNMEGIYEADGQFNTGAAAIPLYIRGSVAAYGGVSMQRDLGLADANAIPAEFFEYAPDQIMLFPKVLDIRKINWKEVAP